LSDKPKYIAVAALSVLVVFSSAFAILSAIRYYSAVNAANTADKEGNVQHIAESEQYEPALSQFEHILTEHEHTASMQPAMQYFQDAVFVGDSRTEGLFLYSDINTTGAVPYAYRGFTTLDILNNEKFLSDGKYVTGIDAIEQNRNFTKVYIMLGVNELSPGGAEEFIERYDSIVKAALETNPDARIIIQSIIPPAKWKSDESDYINSKNTADFNAALLEYAENNGFIWLDVAALLSDKNGNLKDIYDCGDGIHLTQRAYDVWFEYLCYYTYL